MAVCRKLQNVTGNASRIAVIEVQSQFVCKFFQVIILTLSRIPKAGTAWPHNICAAQIVLNPDLLNRDLIQLQEMVIARGMHVFMEKLYGIREAGP